MTKKLKQRIESILRASPYLDIEYVTKVEILKEGGSWRDLVQYCTIVEAELHHRIESVEVNTNDLKKMQHVLSDLALAYITLQQPNQYIRVMKQGIAYLVELGATSREMQMAHIALARPYSTIGKTEEARKLLVRSIVYAMTIQKTHFLTHSLSELAVLEREAGNIDIAHAYERLIDALLSETKKQIKTTQQRETNE